MTRRRRRDEPAWNQGPPKKEKAKPPRFCRCGHPHTLHGATRNEITGAFGGLGPCHHERRDEGPCACSGFINDRR